MSPLASRYKENKTCFALYIWLFLFWWVLAWG